MIHPHKVLQTSSALVAVPTGIGFPKGTIGIYEFLTKSFAYVSIHSLFWLDYFREGVSWATALADNKNLTTQELWSEIAELIDCGFISVADTANWERQSEYRSNWKWDLSSALFHFTISDAEFHSEDECSQILVDQFAVSGGPAKFIIHQGETVALPKLSEGEAVDLLRLMCKRRTNRGNGQHHITRAELGACLFAGFGIVGEVETLSGKLPLKLTPSGGARNPFDAYVLVNAGDELESGIFHYDAYNHTLQRKKLPVPQTQSHFFANQAWTEGKSAIIFLVANFERLMWKYPDPNAYRVMLIEAGHIGQNILLAATRLGLTACPTAALGHGAVCGALGLVGITQQPVYALVLDKPGPYPDRFEANSLFLSLLESAPQLVAGL